MSERRATGAELYAMSKHLGVRCGELQIAYMRCKEKYNHPEDCLQEAKAVVRCSDNLLLEMLEKAPREFKDYCECLDYYTLDIRKCRAEQKTLEKAAPLS
ncbi:MAG: hypothetical protein J3K34DRAFT_215326 [Monoraphidium minutum]|nr:MAG: hypothetical protein J3K34DRAFT_215326 [Monoraphidium minutum]